MENSAAVSIGNGARDLLHQLHASARIGLQCRSDLLKAAAGHMFHAEERQPVFAFTDVVDRQNIWMVEICGRLGFSPEASQGVMGAGVETQDPFERDDAARMPLPRAINYAHAATADLFQDFVISHAPLLVRHLGFAEHALEILSGCLGVRVEAFAQETIDAQAVVQSRSCSALLALFC